MTAVLDVRGPVGRDPYELAARDGRGCLGFLLRAPTREGHSVAELARGAPIAHLSWRALRTIGVAMQPAPNSPFAAVATAHPTLARIFADSVWCGTWAEALATLPGAVLGGSMLFGRHYARGLMLPRQLLVEAVH